jgi:drug/metabolite transporter (DMT)-like permease
VRLERLTRGHVVAAVAALVLLLVMAMDWYGSHAADLAHQVANGVLATGAEAGETGRAVKQDADAIIARDEKNAWQENDTLDRVILALLLLSVLLPLYAAARRADGKRSEPPWTPSAFAGLIAAAAGLLVAYRIINQPGSDVNTTVKIGAPLGLLCLAAIGLGSAWAFQAETRWAEMRQTASGSHPTPPGVAGEAAPEAEAPPARASDQPAS